jgi:antitoxin (DNA-binding transcriptional repressor) of toxin-antitoxin stability system
MTAEPDADAYNIHDAMTNLSHVIDRVEHGEEIIISRGGTPWPKSSPSARAPNGPPEDHSPDDSASPTIWTDSTASPPCT